MKLKEIYELFISTGIKNDPRGEKDVNDLLNERKKEYNKLSDEEKE